MSTVNRTKDDTEVILDCGYTARFFVNDLTDEEYIERAAMLKLLEAMATHR